MCQLVYCCLIRMGLGAWQSASDSETWPYICLFFLFFFSFLVRDILSQRIQTLWLQPEPFGFPWPGWSGRHGWRQWLTAPQRPSRPERLCLMECDGARGGLSSGEMACEWQIDDHLFAQSTLKCWSDKLRKGQCLTRDDIGLWRRG